MPDESPSLMRLLGGGFEHAARIAFVHERRRRFRPVVVLELALFLVGFVCLLPLLLLFAILLAGADGEVELPFPWLRLRFFHHWHALCVRIHAPDDAVLREFEATPATRDEGDAVLSSVLAAAADGGVVVVESFGKGPGELFGVFYGGQPLMTPPEARNEEHAAAVLSRLGFVVERGDDSVVCARRDSEPPYALVLVRGIVLTALSPLLALSRAGRGLLAELWLDLRRVPPLEHRVTVRAEAIELWEGRGAHARSSRVLDGGALVAVQYSAALGYDRDVTRLAPRLRFVLCDRLVDAPFGGIDEGGRALADLVVAATLRLRRARPELGLTTRFEATHCPYCASLYRMEPGSRCPVCGAPARWAPARS